MEVTATRYAVDDAGVATIWLSRPHRHNAWTGRMHSEYRAHVAAAEADPSVRVLVVTGDPAGGAFCVGADSEALAGHVARGGYDDGVAPDVATPGHGVDPTWDHDLAWHRGLRLPVIAAVNGACAGVALALACWCDLRFAVRGARFTTAAPRLALPAEYGLSWILPRLVGLGRASDLLLSGRVIEADEAARIGLVEAVWPAEQFTDEVHRYARRLATAVAPTALAMTKAQLSRDLLHLDPGASVERAGGLLEEAMRGPEFAEGVAALRERRDPRF